MAIAINMLILYSLSIRTYGHVGFDVSVSHSHLRNARIRRTEGKALVLVAVLLLATLRFHHYDVS